MYQPHNLYKKYLKEVFNDEFSADLPDVTKRITLEHMNYAINICDTWENFLDIGGGNGHYSAGLASFFSHGVLAEIGNFPNHAEFILKYPHVKIFHGLIEEYTSTTKFDFILLADLFEHIPDIHAFVKKLAKLQTAGGVVYMLTPNPIYCAPAPTSELYHTKHPYGHIKHYTVPEIVTIMKESGYEMIFQMYEENKLHQKTKRIIKGISRRDKTFQKNSAYKIVRPIILPFLKLFISFLGCVTYASEKRHSNDPQTTMTEDIAFKKIK